MKNHAMKSAAGVLAVCALAAGLAAAGSCGPLRVSSKLQAGVAHPVEQLKPDLAAFALIGTWTGVTHPRPVLIGTVKKVGTLGSLAGRFARIVEFRNGQRTVLLRQAIPALAVGQTFTLEAPWPVEHQEAKFRLVLSSGDDDPANDRCAPPQYPNRVPH